MNESSFDMTLLLALQTLAEMTAPFALFSLAYAAVWYIFTLNPLRRRLEPRTVERVFVLIYIAICTYCFIELFIHFQSAYLEKIPYDEWPDEARLSKDQQAFASFACYPSTNAIDLQVPEYKFTIAQLCKDYHSIATDTSSYLRMLGLLTSFVCIAFMSQWK